MDWIGLDLNSVRLPGNLILFLSDRHFVVSKFCILCFNIVCCLLLRIPTLYDDGVILLFVCGTGMGLL